MSSVQRGFQLTRLPMWLTLSLAVAVAALANLSGSQSAYAAPAGGVQLDASFGVDGVAVPGTAEGIPGPGAIAQDSLGRIYLPDPRAGLAVVRLTPDGQRDTTFGSEGVVVAAPVVSASAVAVDGLGRVLVAGVAGSSMGPDSESVMVARLLSDDSPDPSFGTGGVASVTVPAVGGVARVLAVPGGVAFALADGLMHVYVGRLTDAGTLDSAFGGGIVTLDLPVTPDLLSDDQVADLAVDRQGRLDVAFNATYGADHSGYVLGSVVRLEPDGSQDPAFAPTADRVGGQLGAIQVQSDGDIVLAGGNPTNQDPFALLDIGPDEVDGVLQHLLPDGAPDRAFGSDGAASLDLPFNDPATALARDATGRYIALEEGSLVAFTTAGRLDGSFGACGTAPLTEPAEFAPFAMIQQAHGPLVIAGVAQISAGTQERLELVAVQGAPAPDPRSFPHFITLGNYVEWGTELHSFLTDGSAFPVESPEGASVSLSLTLAGRPPRWLGRTFPALLARGHGQVAACRVTHVVMKPTRAAVRAMRGLDRNGHFGDAGLNVQVRVTLRNASGAHTRTFPSISSYNLSGP